MINQRLYEEFRDIGRDIFVTGLTSSHGGNMSVRVGDKIIIKEYEIASGEGRAGRFVMKKTVTGKWGVPSTFAGTPNNNWITRAIQSVSSIIDRTLAEALK